MYDNVQNNQINKAEKTRPFGNKEMDRAAVIISIIVGIAFAMLVIKDFVGINMFLFSLIAIVGVGYILYKDNNLDEKNFIFFSASFLVYASVFFRLKQEVYTVLTFMILIVLFIVTTMYSSKNSAEKGVLTFLFRSFAPVARADKIFIGLSSFDNKSKEKSRKYKQVLWGVLISVGLLIIVIPLMMSAEVAFEKFVEGLFNKTSCDFQIDKFIGKTVAGSIMAILFCGFLYNITMDKMIGTKQKMNETADRDNHALIITVLTIMGLVFLMFAIVQFKYLFMSKSAVVENTTFAESARQGYFQLVMLSVINFILVMFCTKMQKGSNKISGNVIKILSTYFTVLNIYLLVSSAYKMTMYYDAYGLTVDRLLVYILLVFEFIAIALLMIKIYKKDMRFVKVMIYYSVAFWAVISLINIDASVAKVNINRYEETGKIDLDYITWLSDDVSGEISSFYFEHYDELTKEMKEQINSYYFKRGMYRLWDEYEDDLDIYIIEDYKEIKKFDSWLQFNISKKKKNDDGLRILEHYYETGYIECVDKN